MSRKSKAQEFIQEGYNISVTGRHVQITDAMRDYAIEKISKIERFSTRLIDVIMTMDIQKLEHRVDITLKFDHIKIKATAASENMYASIDKAIHKIESQIRRYKEKIHEHQVDPERFTQMKVNVISAPRSEELLDINDEIEEENQRRDSERFQFHEIVKQEVLPLEHMSYDKALMKMELSLDQFLIFRNERDKKLNVMYRRSDGNYGIIEAEG